MARPMDLHIKLRDRFQNLREKTRNFGSYSVVIDRRNLLQLKLYKILTELSEKHENNTLTHEDLDNLENIINEIKELEENTIELFHPDVKIPFKMYFPKSVSEEDRREFINIKLSLIKIDGKRENYSNSANYNSFLDSTGFDLSLARKYFDIVSKSEVPIGSELKELYAFSKTDADFDYKANEFISFINLYFKFYKIPTESRINFKIQGELAKAIEILEGDFSKLKRNNSYIDMIKRIDPRFFLFEIQSYLEKISTHKTKGYLLNSSRWHKESSDVVFANKKIHRSVKDRVYKLWKKLLDNGVAFEEMTREYTTLKAKESGYFRINDEIDYNEDQLSLFKENPNMTLPKKSQKYHYVESRVRGRSLSDLYESENIYKIPFYVRLRLARKLMETVFEMNNLGIAHQHLHSGNVVISFTPNPDIRVIDAKYLLSLNDPAIKKEFADLELGKRYLISDDLTHVISNIKKLLSLSHFEDSEIFEKYKTYIINYGVKRYHLSPRYYDIISNQYGSNIIKPDD